MVAPPPLAGLKVIELAGLAPGPFAGLMLADAGASVLRIDRPGTSPTPDALTRRKASIAVNLKTAAGARLVLRLARDADVLIEPFRPGVMERLGLGPDALLAANPRLVYARMTGFRRDGRYAAMAGHDINYLAVGGPLALLGRAGEPPAPPVNILGDFAGGGATLVQGILLALLARDRGGGPAGSGGGQVVEANMVDGASYLATFPRLARRQPLLGGGPRGTNVLDGGCPYYGAYRTRDVDIDDGDNGDGDGDGKEEAARRRRRRDGQYMAVGALEPEFFAALVAGLGLAGQRWEERRYDRACWAEMREAFARAFASRTRDEWERVFDGTDACCTPVLDYGELEAAAAARRGDGSAREGDQRPAVTLRATPLLAVDDNNNNTGEVGADEEVARGQGPGVEGGGYDGRGLVPGEGGDERLREWLGWERGRDFEVEDGGLVLKTNSKL